MTALPFSETEDVSEATRAPDDPYTSGWPNVWYRFTPTTDTSLELDTTGSNTSTDVCVYRGTRGALGQVACSSDGVYAHFFAELEGGVTYYVMVDSTAACCPQSLTLSLRDRDGRQRRLRRGAAGRLAALRGQPRRPAGDGGAG